MDKQAGGQEDQSSANRTDVALTAWEVDLDPWEGQCVPHPAMLLPSCDPSPHQHLLSQDLGLQRFHAVGVSSWGLDCLTVLGGVKTDGHQPC